MPIVVMKFGGTSVGSVERIAAVADRVVHAREAGNDVIVVVSAMGHTTDELLAMAARITEVPDPRELDMLLTAGERISMSLLGIALNARGCRAASYTGSQAGIITDTQHGAAKITEIRPRRIIEALEAGSVVILAGFQGLSSDYEITTLGRGGSDLTAVAMAGAVGAEVCEIYTDVDGVFTADPRIVPGARKVDVIGFDEMLELAAAGAKVLQPRSVEMARRHGVPIHVRSTFTDAPGTWVRDRSEDEMEGVLISGVAIDDRRGEGDDRGRARPARRRRADLPRDRDRGHQRRHDRAERVARGQDRHVVHGAARRPAPAAGRPGRAHRRDRGRALHGGRRHREGVARRRRA